MLKTLHKALDTLYTAHSAFEKAVGQASSLTTLRKLRVKSDKACKRFFMLHDEHIAKLSYKPKLGDNK